MNSLRRFTFNQDLEFVVANKVTRIINCASLTIANQWEPIGILYLSFRWNDDDAQIILDPQNQNIAQIFQFIEEAVEKIESVLVVSTKGQSRSSTVIVAYLMKKYKWTLLKTLEYLNSRRPDLEIRTSFIQQLSEYESYLSSNGEGCKTTKWSEVYESNDSFDNEELLLRNTFINSQMGPLAVLDYNIPKSKPFINFFEDSKLATEINYNILHEQGNSVVISHRKKDKSMLTPIIKTPGRSSRNSKIESERSFGKKSDHAKYIITKGPIKKVKMISSQEGLQQSDRSDSNVKTFSSPIMSTDDNEPKAKFPYKKVINLNSHKEKPQTQAQSPLKVNNFVAPETKPLQTGSQFMNMLKNGIQPKQEEKAITNIIQNPSINNIIILNQPNIHVISPQPSNEKQKEPTTLKKAEDQRRPNSCNPKDDKKDKDSVPFPKNPLSMIFKSSALLKDISKCPPSLRASMERNQSEKNILSGYKNGPIK